MSDQIDRALENVEHEVGQVWQRWSGREKAVGVLLAALGVVAFLVWHNLTTVEDWGFVVWGNFLLWLAGDYGLFYLLAGLYVLALVLVGVALGLMVWNRHGVRLRNLYRKLRGQAAIHRGLTARQVMTAWEVLTGPKSPLHHALGGSKPLRCWATDTYWAVKIRLAMGHHPGEAEALIQNLESAFHARPSTVRVLWDDQYANQMTIRTMTVNVLAKPIPWLPPTSTLSRDPIHLGTWEDGSPIRLNLQPADGQALGMLIAGIPGYGKSVLLNLIIADRVGCRDVALAGIDPQGAGFGPWRACFADGLLALNPQQVPGVIANIKLLMERRESALVERGWEYWRPSRQDPMVYLFIDELARVAELGPAIEELDSIVAQCRKDGIVPIAATQSPREADLGKYGKAMIAKMPIRTSMLLEDTTEDNIVFGDGAASAGWRPDRLCREPGHLLIRGPQDRQVRLGRGIYITSEQRDNRALALSDVQPKVTLPRSNAVPQGVNRLQEETPPMPPSAEADKPTTTPPTQPDTPYDDF